MLILVFIEGSQHGSAPREHVPGIRALSVGSAVPGDRADNSQGSKIVPQCNQPYVVLVPPVTDSRTKECQPRVRGRGYVSLCTNGLTCHRERYKILERQVCCLCIEDSVGRALQERLNARARSTDTGNVETISPSL